MEFSTSSSASLPSIKTQALAVGVFEDGTLSAAAQALDEASGGALGAVVKAEFKAKPGERLCLHAVAGVSAARVLLLGLGKQERLGARALQKAHKSLAAYCMQAGLEDAVSTLCGADLLGDGAIDVRAAARIAAQSFVAASYSYTETLSEKKPACKFKALTLHLARGATAGARSGLDQGQAIGAGMNLTRLLGDLPPNICTPSYLADTARGLAKEFATLKAEVLDQKKIEALKMGSFLSVARGSVQPPAFIVLRHTPSKAAARQAAPIVLVGKGITFDAGGISLKPGPGMDEMKYDMCGAASVLGAMRSIAALDLQREVVALIPSCENLPSGVALKPGDIVTSMSGRTIEVLNTDAEGRLILCDALTYAERFKPAAVVDVATLTGACVIALGHVNSGLFSKDDALAASLLAAAHEALDPAWRMPLDDDYQEQLKSNFADMANIGGRPAGSVTAACFLARFADKYPWAHLDIAGTAWLEGKQKGATGRPVPLLVNYLLAQA